MSIELLKEKWLSSLKKKYPKYDESQMVKHLENIYVRFVDSGCCDPKFSSQIMAEQGYQYDHALAEMLFYDVLVAQGFDIKENDGSGPDFIVEKEGKLCALELISPSISINDDGSQKNFHDSYNTHQQSILLAGAKRFPEHDREIFLKITSGLFTKQKKFKEYLDEKKVSSDIPLIVVINDSILCPPNLPMYGVSHSASIGPSPIVAKATLMNETISNNNGEPVELSGFLNNTLSHISAVMQVTLRDDYGFVKYLKQGNSETVLRSTGIVKDYDLVINTNSRVTLNSDMLNMNTFFIDDQGKIKYLPAKSTVTKKDLKQLNEHFVSLLNS
ncbi:hypothetical protein ACPV5J_07545 [Vibrio rotiferianus]|uniref:hypothetical protein n=1 Tax=Vibrio rotiferianus TaxID=190895 RepID=UPI00406AA1C5